MTLLVRFFPVRSREGVEAFTSEMRERGEAVRRFYVDGAIEPRAEQYAASEDRFSLWFKQRIYDLSGVDPNETPKGPPSEMIFDSAGGCDVDPSVRLVVRAYPVRSRDALVGFADELLQRRSSDMQRFYEGVRVGSHLKS